MKQLIIFITGLLLAITANAQHDHHNHGQHKDTVKKEQKKKGKDTTRHKHHDTGKRHKMTHSFSLSLPMNRNGSGTAWQPDNTPVYAYMYHGKTGWNYMLHGNIFIRNTWQNFNNDYKRGGNR